MLQLTDTAKAVPPARLVKVGFQQGNKHQFVFGQLMIARHCMLEFPETNGLFLTHVVMLSGIRVSAIPPVLSLCPTKAARE
ncbi:MAG: hypothetical protein AB7U49_12040 [Hyphomicrobiaceae bacterium]